MGDQFSILTEAEARHLMRRTGFDVKASDVRRYTGKTRDAATRSLVRRRASRFRPRVRFNVNDNDLRREVHDEWLAYILRTGKQFQEKMVLFWHDHFACSNEDVKDLTLVANQNQLLRRHCKGNVNGASFKDFIKAINRDAAMMDFLDTNKNTKNKPNENYGRELQELFALGVTDLNGVPNYTQDDIVQIAKAFTGWKYQTTPALYGQPYMDTNQHDYTSPKTIFTTVGGFGGGGRDITANGTGEIEIDTVVDILFEHRDSDGKSTVARYITQKLLTYLAGTDPDKATIDDIIAKSNFDGSSDPLTAWQLSSLLREILVHDHFYSTASLPRSIKWPVDYVVTALRTLKMKLASTRFTKTITVDGVDKLVTISRAHILNDTANANSIKDRLEGMGQLLFEPPSVFGWDWETAWTNSGTLLERYSFAVAIAQARGSGGTAFRPEILIDQHLTDPGAIVDAVTTLFDLHDQFPVDSPERDVLIAYLTDDGALLPPLNLTDVTYRNRKLNGLFCLILESPAFQLQ